MPCVFDSWYSEPQNEICNRKAEAATNSDWLTIVVRVRNLSKVQIILLLVKYTNFQSVLSLKRISDLNSGFLTELCHCNNCDSHGNIFNGDRFQMLSGMFSLYHPRLFQWLTFSRRNHQRLCINAVQEDGGRVGRWCPIWIWLFPFCFRHWGGVLWDAVRWMESE